MPVIGSREFEVCDDLAGAGSKVAIDLARLLTDNLVEISAKCMDALDTGEHPLASRERSMYSALAAAVDRITPAHLSEEPMERISKSLRANNLNDREKIKKAMDDVRGRVDLYCKWRDLDFLI
jgi:hypothetical protein